MNTTFNLAEISEAIAAAIPDRECIVFRDRRYTWAQFNERTRRLGNYLREPRPRLPPRARRRSQNFESGQDHLGHLPATTAPSTSRRCSAPTRRASRRSTSTTATSTTSSSTCSTTPTRARSSTTRASRRTWRASAAELPKLDVLLQVADELRQRAAARARSTTRRRSRSASPHAPDVAAGRPTTSTSSTPAARPACRRACCGARRTSSSAPSAARRRCGPKFASVDGRRRGRGRRATCAPARRRRSCTARRTGWRSPRCTRAAPSSSRRSPSGSTRDDIWSTIEREKVRFLTIVGDAFGRPLLDQLDAQALRPLAPSASSLSGGAILTPALKDAFLERIPHLMIIDGFGASETGGAGPAGRRSAATRRRPARSAMNEDTLVLTEDLSGPLAPGSEETGWLARTGHVPLGYFKDAEKTAKTFPVIGGARYAVPGDHARVGGRRHHHRPRPRLGVASTPAARRSTPRRSRRRSSTIRRCTTRSSSARPSERFGEQVTAVVQTRAGESADRGRARSSSPPGTSPATSCRAPIVFVDEMVRSPSGKADYRWAKKLALERLGIAPKA